MGPITAPNRIPPPPQQPSNLANEKIEWGPSAREAPITPGNRHPVVDRTKVDPQVLKAAQGMESMFLDYLMQVMRKTVPESEMSNNSNATKIYRSMMDAEVAQNAAKAGGIGLADQIIAYMTPQSYNLKELKENALAENASRAKNLERMPKFEPDADPAMSNNAQLDGKD